MFHIVRRKRTRGRFITRLLINSDPFSHLTNLLIKMKIKTKKNLENRTVRGRKVIHFLLRVDIEVNDAIRGGDFILLTIGC